MRRYEHSLLSALIIFVNAGCSESIMNAPSQTAPSVATQEPPAVPEDMARALRAYDQENFPEAASLLEHILNTQSNSDDQLRMQAEFFLGKTYFNQQRYQKSLTLFSRVVRTGRNHRYFLKTLLWLAALNEKLPPSSRVSDAICPYQIQDIEHPSVYEYHLALYYTLGQCRMNQGNQREARELLGRIVPESPYYQRAMGLLARIPLD